MAHLEPLMWAALRLVVWASLALADSLVLSGGVWAAEDYSNAETQLFMQPHFQQRPMPTKLTYQFNKSAGVEPAFQDQVLLDLSAQKGPCCQTKVTFLSGERRLELPDVPQAKGNPVILYFLERDIRDLQRLTQGQSHYFRTRIRKALYQTALERPVNLRYKGRTVSALEFEITPYQDDPMRERMGAWADKHYAFTLSPSVPGTVVAIRTWVSKPGEFTKQSEETLLLAGATL